MSFNTIVSILPRPIWPPYAGQSRLCFFRSLELKKRGLKTILIEFYFFENKRSKKQNKEISKAFNEVYSIKISFLDCILIFFILCGNLFFKSKPLQSLFLSSEFLLRKFKRIMKNIKKNNKKVFVHCYSIRSYRLWELISSLSINFSLDFVDSMTLNLQNKLYYSKFFSKIFFKYELKKTTYFERNLIQYKFLKSIIAVTKKDLDYFSFKKNKMQNRNIKYIESGIGINPMKYELIKSKKRFEKNFGNILFFGSLSYEPNIVALNFLLEELIPYLNLMNLNCRFKIAGRNPRKSLIKKIELMENVQLMANPLNMEKIIDDSFISLVPIFSGSGQQYKAVESLSRGVPIVISKKAAKALSLRDRSHCLIANNIEEFAYAIKSYMHSEKLYKSISLNGLDYVNNQFSWKSKVKDLIQKVYI